MNKLKKKNLTFVYLYALGIIMVLDDHTGHTLNILTSIFPYNSFYMPLFVFSSGYFFSLGSAFEKIKSKIKKLLVPYIIYNFIFVIIAMMINHYLKINWVADLSVKSFFNSFITLPMTDANSAAWFIIMLFWVSIIYVVIRLLIKSNIVVDSILAIYLIAIGFWCIHECKYNYPQSVILLWVYRTMFYLQFYHLGYMFKQYYEHILRRFNKKCVCILCISINFILVLNYDINFSSTLWMHSFNNVFLPLVTSITGIVFYYELASYMADKLGENKIVSFIGSNTFTVLEVHLLLSNIPNFYCYYNYIHGNINYSDFPIDAFRAGAWVRYNYKTNLVSFVCCLVGSLSIALLINKIKK